MGRAKAMGSVMLVGAATLVAPAVRADDFYKGKTLEIYVGTDVGGAYDAYARLLARHINRHLPGVPTTIVRNMPGAASVVLTNYLYKQAKKDGTEFGIVNQGIPTSQALNEKGVAFDARQMNWIGSTHTTVNVAFAWHTAAAKTIEDVKRVQLIVGTTGAGSATSFYPELMNQLLGTKFKIVGGYVGQDMLLAIERGEVEGRGAYNWANLRDQTTWVKEKKVNILVQMGAERAPDLPDVPLMHELASKPEDREILEFVSLAPSVGRPFVAPPRLPEERVKMLRDAFDASMVDKELLAEANKSNLEILPTSGAKLAEIVNRNLNVSPETVKRAKEIMK
jgi:tripartite-type tricarboxylate transporter receptor subunit TctC